MARTIHTICHRFLKISWFLAIVALLFLYVILVYRVESSIKPAHWRQLAAKSNKSFFRYPAPKIAAESVKLTEINKQLNQSKNAYLIHVDVQVNVVNNSQLNEKKNATLKFHDVIMRSQVNVWIAILDKILSKVSDKLDSSSRNSNFNRVAFKTPLIPISDENDNVKAESFKIPESNINSKRTDDDDDDDEVDDDDNDDDDD